MESLLPESSWWKKTADELLEKHGLQPKPIAASIQAALPR